MKIQYAMLSLLCVLQLSACSSEPKKSAVVAKSDIFAGYPTTDKIAEGEVDQSKCPQDVLTSTSDADGTANRDIKAGEAIAKGDLVAKPCTLFAKKDLGLGAELAEEDIEVKFLSKQGHDSDVFVASKREAVGRTARKPIKAGDPIFDGDLGPKVMFH
jgi:Flp pilus assembly protein CpaB